MNDSPRAFSLHFTDVDAANHRGHLRLGDFHKSFACPQEGEHPLGIWLRAANAAGVAYLYGELREGYDRPLDSSDQVFTINSGGVTIAMRFLRDAVSLNVTETPADPGSGAPLAFCGGVHPVAFRRGVFEAAGSLISEFGLLGLRRARHGKGRPDGSPSGPFPMDLFYELAFSLFGDVGCEPFALRSLDAEIAFLTYLRDERDSREGVHTHRLELTRDPAHANEPASYLSFIAAIDGEPLHEVIDLHALAKSVQASGRKYIFTCTCGEAGCANRNAVLIRHLPDGRILWLLNSGQRFRFERAAYAGCIHRALNAVVRDLSASRDPRSSWPLTTAAYSRDLLSAYATEDPAPYDESRRPCDWEPFTPDEDENPSPFQNDYLPD